jgi:hypothetical protein
MDAGTGEGRDETSVFFATGFSFRDRDAIEEFANELFVIALITTNCSVREDFIAAHRSESVNPRTQVAGLIIARDKLP